MHHRAPFRTDCSFTRLASSPGPAPWTGRAPDNSATQRFRPAPGAHPDDAHGSRTLRFGPAFHGDRHRLRALQTLLMCVALGWLSGCATLIIPPFEPADPVSVFVLDHGRHSSLLLPTNDGTAVRYSYGDWDYYVLRQTGLFSALRALLTPSPGALGQQRLAGPPEAGVIGRQLRVEVLALHEIKVDSASVDDLRDELGELFAAAQDPRHYSNVFDVHFVRHPEPYTLANNSNRMVKRWLEQLGCEVRGRPLLSNWRLRQPPNGGAAHPL